MTRKPTRTLLTPSAITARLLPDAPQLVQLYIANVAIGVLLACAFTAMLVGFDVAHLRHLVFSSSGGWLAVLMMVVFNTVVFAGVQFAIAVMRMAEEDRPKGGRRFRLPSLPRRAVPVPAAAKAGPRR